MNTPTFKKHKRETGLSSVAHPNPDTDIKTPAGIVGTILAPSAFAGNGRWRIMLRIAKEATPDDPCEWRNALLKRDHESEPDAREFLKEKWGLITGLYTLSPTKE